MINRFQLNLSWLTLGFIASAAIGIAMSYGDVYLFHVFMIMTGLVTMFKMNENKFRYHISALKNHYSLFLVIFLLWYGLSLVWSPDPLAGMKYLFYIICGIAISFSIIQYGMSQSRIKSIMTVLGFVFGLEIIFALLESFTAFRLPISPYSNWHTSFGKASVDFYAFDNPFAYSDFRPPTGFHWNTNNLAITMILVLPFFLCSQKLWIKVLGGSAITIITILAASRAVFIGLIFVLCLYLIAVKKRVGTLSLIWVSVIALFWGMQILSESDDPRINEVANSIEAVSLYLAGDIDIGGSLEWRRELVDNGMDAFKQSKGLGVGAGGSTVLQERMGGVAGRFTSMHNFWVEILVEGGFLITTLALFWYSGLILNMWKLSKEVDNPFIQYMGQSLLLALLGFIPAAIAASSTIYFFPMWIMFGLAISMIVFSRNELADFS